jgi:alpha-galactosidase
MKSPRILLFTALVSIVVVIGAGISACKKNSQPAKESATSRAAESASFAPTPPLGWNSYDSYCGDVNEQEVKANAEYLAKHLARYGWKYVVIDYYWYYPSGKVEGTPVMDRYGRLLPAPNRFPSAAGGRGFKPLADYVHSLGLKFGIHIMRGIPRAAVEKNMPILGTAEHAQDVASLLNTSSWSKAMYGVDVSKPAGPAYYNSLADLYAQWDVDFIKADDMSSATNPYGEVYHAPEIEALRQAMNHTGRPMVLSLSPGPTPLGEAANVEANSQMWRISGDMWDDWQKVSNQFGPNHWPDADMLPLGRLRIRGYQDGPRLSRLTHDEQRTLMTLWSIFRSPLMMGGDLPSLDSFTLSLLTNDEVLAVDQHSSHNHLLFTQSTEIAWVADLPGTKQKYVALFNLGETPATVTVSWKELGLSGKNAVRDLWQKKDLGTYHHQFGAEINPHSADLYKLSPM